MKLFDSPNALRAAVLLGLGVFASAQGAPAVESAKALMEGSSRASPGTGLDLELTPL